jgi:hypothetical protein
MVQMEKMHDSPIIAHFGFFSSQASSSVLGTVGGRIPHGGSPFSSSAHGSPDPLSRETQPYHHTMLRSTEYPDGAPNRQVDEQGYLYCKS